ncbi:3-phosphoshikimate 1-carboxyvinyltransferase [Lysinibacter sp. HNR]|uniref:3-phosphoshikimate 1-carboxyvinyltransferase n=1 Tax=Lysinibacter sp. HNR TaxID=3031408 RepID=UPI002435444D|nr:3-phosphoshikimate 1-carboxyvinyltransferase [Lysinibacter sp. HNR]WGD36937.1 3-phosphoshikimate 1-carboxyvinyltransferase [Lysinibacter sp. HNR]
MLISKYSQPDFNPFGDEMDSDDEPQNWPAPTPGKPLAATVNLPGSKSLTNRELVLSALAATPSRLRAPLHSRDSNLMVEALRSLGATVEETPGNGSFGPDWLITPGELVGSTSVDCGLAGTVMRFVPPVAALALGPTSFDGDEHARNRPMSAIVEGLRSLGVDITDEGRGKLPFTIHGMGSVPGGRVEIDASLSSQFVSGLALAAARFDTGAHIVHTGERLPSVPHITMTLEALTARGVVVEHPAEGEWVIHPGPILGVERDIEPDLSNAAPFLAAAVVLGGSVSIPGWPSATTQVGDQLRTILPHFGAEVVLENGVLTVTGPSSISGVTLDLSEAGELAPAVVGLAALATGPSTITGIGHIRHHETDRIAALSTEINKLGGNVTELEDGLQVVPAPLHGGVWLSYSDHRMATTGALIGLAVAGVEVNDVGTTAKTLPQFTDLWLAMISSHSQQKGHGSRGSGAHPTHLTIPGFPSGTGSAPTSTSAP